MQALLEILLTFPVTSNQSHQTGGMEEEGEADRGAFLLMAFGIAATFLRLHSLTLAPFRSWHRVSYHEMLTFILWLVLSRLNSFMKMNLLAPGSLAGILLSS